MEHERGAFKVNRRMKVGAVKKSCPKGMFCGQGRAASKKPSLPEI
jgi:hypothetical protein